MFKSLFRKQSRSSAITASEHDFVIKPAAQLLQQHHGKVAEIKTIIAVSDNYWQTLYLSALENLAALCQDLPASEYHHHSYQGGLLAHALDVTVRALKYRIGKILPENATPDEITQQQQVWTYAVFCSALLHDIGKPLADQVVTLQFANGKSQTWRPLVENMQDTGALTYCYHYYRDRDGKRNYHLHELATSLFITRIIPKVGLSWLSDYKALLPIWLHSLHGLMVADNPIYALVKKADQDSVATDLNGMEVRPTSNIIKSLPERMALKLRQLVDNQSLKINAFGCQGWVKDGFAYMVIKPTLDAIRDDMLQEQQTGIPMNNLRLIDELQSAGVVTSQLIDDKYQAKYLISISHPDWDKQLELSVLRFRVASIWQSNPPAEFTGSITILNSAPKETAPEPNQEPAPASSQEAITTPETPEISEQPAPVPATIEPADATESSQSVQPSVTPPAKPSAPKETVTSQEDDIAPWGKMLAKSLVTPYPNSPPKQAAKAFLRYLSAAINDKSILYNDAAAHVHITAEGVFLVSPRIFRAYDADNWSMVQKGLNALRVTKKEKDGTNIFQYRVNGKGILRGMLIDKNMIPAVLGEIRIPAINPKLSLIKDDQKQHHS